MNPSMHALSVQYYEIIQLYRSALKRGRISRCLLIPMKIVDFSAPDVVRRFRMTLTTAALTPEIQTEIIQQRGLKTAATPSPAPQGSDFLTNHLQSNALYYSQAIWNDMSAPEILARLESYTFQGENILKIVDPTPLATTGTYLAFGFYSDDDQQWSNFLREYPDLKVGIYKEDMVPVTSSRLFAEELLGRFTLTAPFDLTSSYSRQEDPPPINVVRLAPIKAVSRTRQEDPSLIFQRGV